MTTIATKKDFRIGTWNVRTLRQTGKLAQAGKIMEKYGLMILGMSEVRWNECGELVTTNGHTMLWSGMPNSNDTHQYGVGMLVHKLVRNTIMSYKFISERIMLVRIRCKYRNTTFIQCYAPTEEAQLDVKESFYDMLSKTLTETAKNDLVILMGDFNAKVGSDNLDIENVMGKHGIGKMNENGELLVELCGLNKLKIGGTLFPHKTCHKVTWVSPDSITQNQIDHICISAKWSNTLHDVRNKRGADISSDHHLLVGHLRLSVKPTVKPKTKNRIKYDIDKLKSDSRKTAFCNTLREKLNTTNTPNNNIQHEWENFKNAVNTSCQQVLGPVKYKKQDHISPNTWSLIDKRADAKNVVNSAKNANERKKAQEQYKVFDKCVKREVRDDKREYMNTLAKQAEDAAAVHNMKDLYNITKQISNTGVTKNVPVKDKGGVLLTTVEDQLKRWKEHFNEVLNIQREGIVVPSQIEPTPLHIKTTPPTRSEIINAIKSLKNGKAAGVDSICAEVLKADPNIIADKLLPLFSNIWQQETFPSDWKEGIIVKLPKKGDLTDCNNWRGINILCVVMKVFCKIILERMVKLVDVKIRPEQAGFRAGRSCTDQASTLRIIIEQSVEMRSPLYLLFVDYEKAFDSVSRECIWTELRNLGVPEKLISLIRSSYDGFACRVLHNGSLSDAFTTLSGVRQGCLLSPLLFLVIMDAVVKRATFNKPRGIVFNPLRMNERLECLDFADDKCEMAHKFEDMQHKLADLASESSKVGLKINKKKTKEMRINVNNNRQLKLDDQIIERVSEFQYLGCTLAEDGGAEVDVRNRIKKARGAYIQLRNIWASNEYSKKTKVNIFRSCVLSVLLYGCETWLVTERIKSLIQVFVNRCLRRIFRIFWPNTISNQELWEKADMKNINLEIRKRKFGWIGHTLRRDPSEVCYKALVYNPQGSRRVGRPRNTWRRSTLDEINKQLPDRQITNVWDLKNDAARRIRWRKLVDGLCST